MLRKFDVWMLQMRIIRVVDLNGNHFNRRLIFCQHVPNHSKNVEVRISRDLIKPSEPTLVSVPSKGHAPQFAYKWHFIRIFIYWASK